MRPSLRNVVALLLLYGPACGHAAVPTDRPVERTTLELVESSPAETTLDTPDIRNTPAVWAADVDAATKSIDFASFYASESESGRSLLTPIIDALVRAAGRGVKVRFLVDALFANKYPDTLARFERVGIAVHRLDEQSLAGGVMHAKYYVVDGERAYIGSANFDWRSLEHIVELGSDVRSRVVAGALADIFETDWRLAEGAPKTTRIHAHAYANALPTEEHDRITLVASPSGWLPDESEWELPRLVRLLDEAKHDVALQVLTYKTVDRAKQPFTTLDEAVRRAIARGVKVRLLVSEWGANDRSLIGLSKLAEIRVLRIPKWSGGDIPFARVAHAKYLVVDRDAAWVGSSNWEGDYFTRTRNVGLVIEGPSTPARLQRLFERNWSSAYVTDYGAGAPPSSTDPERR